MKKIFALMLAVLLMFSFAGCGEDKSNTNSDLENSAEQSQDVSYEDEGGNIEQSNVASDSPEISTLIQDDVSVAAPVTSSVSSKINLKPDALEIVKIYVDNQNVWKIPQQEMMDGCHYGFLDLDFDGVLELVTCNMGGSGRYSYNNYYKVNLSTKKVQKISGSYGMNDGDWDFIDLESKFKLYKNRSSGKMFYYCGDFVSAGRLENGTYYGKMYMQNGAIKRELLFNEGTYGGQKNYSYYLNGKWAETSKSEYDKKMNRFLSENTDLNLKLSFADAAGFDENSNGDKVRIMKNTYDGFSYTGF